MPKVQTDSTIITCPMCKIELGEALFLDGIRVLRVGSLLVRDMQAFCINCGRVIYWSVSNQAISRLVIKREEDRKKTEAESPPE